MQKMRVESLGWEDPLGEEMATHSSILAWEIPWTEDPGGLPPMGSQKESDATEWLTKTKHTTCMYTYMYVYTYIYTYIYKRMCAHPFVHTCTCIHPEFHFSLCDLSCHNFKTQMKSPVLVLWLSFLCWWCTFFFFPVPFRIRLSMVQICFEVVNATDCSLLIH